MRTEKAQRVSDISYTLPAKPCRRCDGTGYTLFGYLGNAVALACRACGGTGVAKVITIRLSSGT